MKARKTCALCGKAIRRGSRTVIRGNGLIHIACVGRFRNATAPAIDWKSAASGERPESD